MRGTEYLVTKDSININTKDVCQKLDKLREIVDNVLEDTDSDKTLEERSRIKCALLYIMWWESQHLTKNVQDRKGPARGIMQIEPATLWDLIKNYIFGPKEGLVKNLADAAGVSEDEMKKALQDFKDNNQGKNSWPKKEPARNLEEWLTKIDSFGIELMRYQLERFQDHKFPDNCEDLDAQAEHWARWWKKSFGKKKDKPETIEKKKKAVMKKFKEHANTLREQSKKCEMKKEKEKEKTKPEKDLRDSLKESKKEAYRKPISSVKKVVAGIFVLVIIIIGVVSIIDYYPSEVRNCIRSVFGNPPSCSDTSERILPTTCNGRDIGKISYSEAEMICS